MVTPWDSIHRLRYRNNIFLSLLTPGVEGLNTPSPPHPLFSDPLCRGVLPSICANEKQS